MTNDIQSEQRGALFIIRFNRPEKKNALTLEMYNELNNLLDKAARDDKVKVLIFSSTSNDFTAGNDVKDFLENPPLTNDAPVYKFVNKLARFEKVMIAAVDGLAVGLGFTMLLHCDFVYMSEKTKLMAPFVNLGLVPEAGSTKLLKELVGQKKTAEILLLGNLLIGSQAVELGIATELLDSEKLEAKAIDVGEVLSRKPPTALNLTKELLQSKEEIIEVVQKEIEFFREQVKSPEAREAFEAILEKRKPDFSKFN